MDTYLILLLIILFVVIITYVEYKVTRNKIQFNVRCPKKIAEVEYKNDKYIIYNNKYKEEVKTKISNSPDDYYKIIPQITIPQRIKIILNNRTKIESININNIITSIVPTIYSFFDILTMTNKSKYRILTTNPVAEATTDEKHIYII